MIPDKVKDLTDLVFDQLTVLGFDRIQNRKTFWKCRCTCGKETSVRGDHLLYLSKKGEHISCGCYNRSLSKKPRVPNTAYKKRYYNYTESAKKRGLEFNLSVEDFTNLVKQPCHYCGNIREDKEYGVQFTGVDRVDSTKGYSIDNCVPCCDVCNYAKRQMTVEEFYEWIRAVYHKRYGWN